MPDMPGGGDGLQIPSGGDETGVMVAGVGMDNTTLLMLLGAGVLVWWWFRD